VSHNQLIVDGLAISYNRVGAGDVVLLLHGWGDNKETYKALHGLLQDNYEVIAVDLPGFGLSESPTTAWGLNNYSNFLTLFLQKLGIHKLRCVIGHSNGGAIAINALANSQISADKLVLIASAGIRLSNQSTMKKTFTKIIKLSLKLLPGKWSIAVRKKVYAKMGSELFHVPGMEESFKKIVAQDLQTEAASLKLPTYIIYGADDTSTPPSFGQIYANLISDSELIIIPEAGHFVHQQKSEKVNKMVKSFIDL